MNYHKTILLFVVAGCADSPRAQVLPGADVDQTTGRITQMVSENVRPCGYTHTEDFRELTPDQHHVYTARLTYNQRGDVVLDAAVDEAEGLSYSHATEYNAMGQPSSYIDTYSDSPTSRLWLTYDSFGRLARYSDDEDGDGVEDWVSTYGYGNDGDRITAHHVGNDGDYDRTYGYDDRGRVVEVRRDNGPDGVVDEISKYVYDEAQRVTTMTMTDPTGHVLQTDTTHYDADNHVVLEEYYSIRNRDRTPINVTYTNTYEGGRLQAAVTFMAGDSPDPVVDSSTTRDDYQYDGCD